jgi:branched-chain amino acid transport system permease protein
MKASEQAPELPREVRKRTLFSQRAGAAKYAPAAVATVIAGLIPVFVRSPYYLHTFILTLIYIVAAVSLRTIMISGQFPLAHGAFMGIGAYTAGLASYWGHWTPWLTIPLGAVMAAAIGIVIGYPFARLRAIYYAMISLFFGLATLYIIFAFGRWTGSYSGFGGVQPLFGGPSAKIKYYYFFLGLMVVCLVILHRFESSRFGLSEKAIAQSHLVAASVGINEAAYRVLALGFGCFFVGLVGAAYAHYNTVVGSTSFNLTATLWLVMYTLIGGKKRFAGPIVGTIILVIIPELVRGLKSYAPFVNAAILLIVVYVLPDGIVSLPGLVWSRIKDRKREEQPRDQHAAGN